MFLKAGGLSLALLLASRLLGLLRESVQAAAFGTSGMADVAVLMLTLPDWLTGVLASGALAYVLLPHWAQQAPAQQGQTQRFIARWLLAVGVAMGVLLWVFQASVIRLLAGGLPPTLTPQAVQGVVWCAVSLPAALLAALWGTRLQHERDFIGLYGANLVVNISVVIALFLIATNAMPISTVSITGTSGTINTITQLGLGLVLAMGLRLLWLRLRLAPFQAQRQALLPAPLPVQANHERQPPLSSTSSLPSTPSTPSTATMPKASLWLWAALSAGLPLTLPFAARAFVSASGEGALATFNYAWKLVELPLVLAIQLVATLAFPAITSALMRALANKPADALPVVRGAFALAWTLACAAIAALQLGAPAIAGLLFGWGRMGAESVASVAAWGAVGAWGLLPQALIAVALTVLAALGRMHAAVLAYAVALAVVLVSGLVFGLGLGGAGWMRVLNAVLTGVALLVLWAVQAGSKKWCKSGLCLSSASWLPWLPWKAMLAPAAMLGILSLSTHGTWRVSFNSNTFIALISSASAAILIIAVSALTSAELRSALRR